MNLNKKADESELQYIWRLALAKDSGSLDMTWEELADVFNENLENNYGSSAYRKKFQQAQHFYDDVFSKMDDTEYSQELMKQKRELERLKIQFRDERNAWNKQNYTDARVEQKLDYLEEELRNIGKIDFPEHEIVDTKGDNDMLVILSDFHIGQCFDSAWGKYNSDIAFKRVEQLAEKVRKVQYKHKSENLYIAISGDLISGNIHKSIAITNREDVITQIKIASKIIINFCYNMSKYFKKVYVTNVAGNHSRIDKKDDALHSERLDDLVGWVVNSSLQHIDNIIFLPNRLDIGIGEMTIRGKQYVSVHGDYDKFSKSGVENLVMMIGYIPYAVLFGHLHVCSLDECNGVKMIRGGSLAGAGDQYTIEKRLIGKPAQMICICDEKGVDCYYPVELD